jgi:hypothetical protein
MLGVSQLTRVGPLLRATLRAGAAAGLIVLGVLAAFSIGLPILVAGILAAVAFGLSVEPARWQWTLVAGGTTALIATAVLIGGLDVTQRIIVCPQTGQSGGGGTGLFTGQYQWSCDNGQPTWGPGG